jgi:hypothetical protein
MAKQDSDSAMIGGLDWTKDDVLSSMKGLQERCAFTDVAITCQDGLVLEAHMVVMERHSKVLREHARGAQCCLCRGNTGQCNSRYVQFMFLAMESHVTFVTILDTRPCPSCCRTSTPRRWRSCYVCSTPARPS